MGWSADGDTTRNLPLDARAVAALARLPSGLFVMTASFEDQRAGVQVRSVQQCANEPPLVAVALRRGHAIEPIIRDSRAFAVNMLSAGDRLLLRKFHPEAESHGPPDEAEDPLVSVPVGTLVTGSPVLKRCALALDCAVVRHLDVEADHGLYIGQVVGAHVVEADDGPQI